jgi:hypothetical protein
MVIEHLCVVRDRGEFLGGLTPCRSPTLVDPFGDDDFQLVLRYAPRPRRPTYRPEQLFMLKVSGGIKSHSGQSETQLSSEFVRTG